MSKQLEPHTLESAILPNPFLATKSEHRQSGTDVPVAPAGERGIGREGAGMEGLLSPFGPFVHSLLNRSRPTQRHRNQTEVSSQGHTGTYQRRSP